MRGVAKREVTAQRDDADSAPAQVVGRQMGTVPRVLCIDDEPAMLAVLARALGPRVEVVTLDDPVAALSLIGRCRDFSVVISDMKMPQMHGADFLARVKELAPSTTRLALTACLEQELTPDEVFGILTKPCPLKLLHESVAAAIQHHELLQRTAAVARAQAFGERGPCITTLPDGLANSGIQARSTDPAGPEHDLPLVTAEAPTVVSARLYLQLLGKYTELGPRATLLGRAPDCDIVVNDPRVDLRHLRFFNSWRGVTLQALSRTGDVRLNGQAFTGPRHVGAGDWISIGPFHAELRSQSDVEGEE